MSQFGMPDSNDNVLKDGNKLTSISNRDQKRGSLTHKRAPDGLHKRLAVWYWTSSFYVIFSKNVVGCVLVCFILWT